MRKPISVLLCAFAVSILAVGCSGPSYKLGRGLNNMTEFSRGGDLRRSVEQTYLWQGPEAAYTTGVIQGFNRSVVRTFAGVAEVVTFPIPTPSYEPFYAIKGKGAGDVYIGGPYQTRQFWSFDFLTRNPTYPSNFHPGVLADSTFATDTALGFSAGDAAPFVPGSRFHVFDY